MKIQLFNARANAVQQAELSAVGTKQIEYHAKFADGHTVKFPFTTDENELRSWIEKHNKHNAPAVTAESQNKYLQAANEVLKKL